MFARFGLVMVALTTLLFALAGCGGGGGGSDSSGGGFRLTIHWPTSDRHIPSLTTRIHLTIDQAGVIVPGGDTDLLKPANGSSVTTTEFKELPTAVPLNFHAQAFGSAPEGAEVLLGTVDSSVVLQKGLTNIVVLDLVSTIDHLVVTSTEFEDGSLTVAPGQSTQLAVEAHAAGTDGALIPLDPTKLRFVANGAGFTVNTDGVIRGTAFGSGSLNVADLDSGKSVDVPVTVKSPVRSLEIGTAGVITIVNHNSQLALRPLIKALDKNGQPVENAQITFTVTGTGLTYNATSGFLGADEGVVTGEGTIATGQVHAAVVDSTLTADATVHVLAHADVSSLFLTQDSFSNKIVFNVLIDYTMADIVTKSTTNPGDFEVAAIDSFGNQVTLQPSDLTFQIPNSAKSHYKLETTPDGARLSVTDFTHEANTNLTVTHVATQKKLVIVVQTRGVV